MSILLITLWVLLYLKAAITIATSVTHWRRRGGRRGGTPFPAVNGVSVVIAAYNEEVGIGATLDSVIATGYPLLEVIVVDDGSKDSTASVVEDYAERYSFIRLVRQANAGKAAALNKAIRLARYEVIVSVDADSYIEPEAIHFLAQHFSDPYVGAVAGNIRVGNTESWLARFQLIEYTVGQQYDKRAQDLWRCIVVVPGATGAFRRDVLLELGGYSTDTITEDMDLTMEIGKLGYKVIFEPRAQSHTEVPVAMASLLKQRVRWMYGTLQVLIKHRRSVLNPKDGMVGLLGLPFVLVSGIGAGLLAPLVDTSAVVAYVALGAPDSLTYAFLVNLALDLFVLVFSLVMGKELLRYTWLLWFQRAFYRLFVAYVIIKALAKMLGRQEVSWNKLERQGLTVAGSAQPFETRPPVRVGRPANMRQR